MAEEDPVEDRSIPIDNAVPGSKRTMAVKRVAFLGLSCLFLGLFAGYALALHSRHLAARKSVTLLGERNLSPAAPGAFRLVGFDLGHQQPLPISRAVLTLRRAGERDAQLTSAQPGQAVADLNVRLPAWAPGPATMEVEYRSPAGDGTVTSTVFLDPGATSRLRLLPPSAELKQPVLRAPPDLGGSERAGIDPSRKPGPVGFQIFPVGGWVSSSFAARFLVRAMDARGISLAGRLRVGAGAWQLIGPDGLAEIDQAEVGASQRLALSFEGPHGRLAQEVELHGRPSQIELTVEPILAASGQTLKLSVTTVSESGTLYVDGWWTGGFCLVSQLEVVGGRAKAELPVPAGIEGPLLIRARDDPFGQGEAMRVGVVFVGKDRPPTVAAGFSFLQQLSGGEAFWNELRGFSASGLQGLQALLSRVRAPEGALPELADGRPAEEAAVAAERDRLASIGLTVVGVVSLLGWLAVAGLLFPFMFGAEKGRRRRPLGLTLVALAVVGFGLLAGWTWLFWVVG